MIRYFRHALLVLLCAVVAGPASVRGTVLCVADDGHVAVEVAGGCEDVAPFMAPATTPVANETVLSLHGSCVDVPLATLTAGRHSEHVTADLPLPRLSISSLLDVPRAIRAVHPPSSPKHHRLVHRVPSRTVVLLV